MVTIVNKHFNFEGLNLSDINNKNGFSKLEFCPLNKYDNIFKHLVQIVIIIKLNPIFYDNKILFTLNKKWFDYEKSINPDTTNLFNIGTTILMKIPFDDFIETLSFFEYTNIEVKLNNNIPLKKYY